MERVKAKEEKYKFSDHELREVNEQKTFRCFLHQSSPTVFSKSNHSYRRQIQILLYHFIRHCHQAGELFWILFIFLQSFESTLFLRHYKTSPRQPACHSGSNTFSIKIKTTIDLASPYSPSQSCPISLDLQVSTLAACAASGPRR